MEIKINENSITLDGVEYIKKEQTQNWWVNILGAIILLIACSNKNTLKSIKSVL